MQARGVLADLLARSGEDFSHLRENHQPRIVGPVQRIADDLVGDAFGLDIELDGGDAVARAADFEIHIAEMIFFAEDVGQQLVLVAFLNQADGDAGDGFGDRHARIHQGETSAAATEPSRMSHWIPECRR